jgi:hypothetical protein
MTPNFFELSMAIGVIKKIGHRDLTAIVRNLTRQPLQFIQNDRNGLP